jgi:hypothetical protein
MEKTSIWERISAVFRSKILLAGAAQRPYSKSAVCLTLAELQAKKRSRNSSKQSVEVFAGAFGHRIGDHLVRKLVG